MLQQAVAIGWFVVCGHAYHASPGRRRQVATNAILPATDSALPNELESRRPKHIQAELALTGYKYYCHDCRVGFLKERNYQQHRAGKAHAFAVLDKKTAWADFAAAAPSWAARSAGHSVDVLTPWRASEFATFPMRARSMDPSATLSSLTPAQRGRFFRYLRDTFGAHYPEFAAIFHHLDATFPQYCRVKELFESLEAYQLVASQILTAQRQGRATDAIYDLACGHGLVGILLGYRFPRKRVVCVDLERRPAFDALASAWAAQGLPYADGVAPLGNVAYVAGDLNDVLSDLTPASCAVALHACNDANRDVVAGAARQGALWAVMPCCIRSQTYLAQCSVEVDDDLRYSLLCGAFANEYGAQLVRTINPSITGRPVFVAGGLHYATADTELLTGNGGAAVGNALPKAPKVRKVRPAKGPMAMPKLRPGKS